MAKDKKINLAAVACFLMLASLASCVASRQETVFIEAPRLVSINIIDRNGLSETINNPERLELYENVDFLQPQPYQKVLRVYCRNQQGNIPACITSYHPNGYPRQYLEVINSRACGNYKEWYQNGVLKIEAKILEGTADLVEGAEKSWIFDGCCQAWSENGDLEATVFYLKGELDGVSIYFHANGKTWKSISYRKNKLDGLFEVYRPDGILLLRIHYKDGLKEGPSQRFWNDGVLAADEIYCEGLLSHGRYYDLAGKCIAAIDEGNGIRAIFNKEGVSEFQEYRDGQIDGTVTVLDKYGRISRVYRIKNECKHGEEICYHEAVRLKQKLYPKLSINWYEGKVQGMVKTWYDNGIQESQREMSQNKKNGHSTAWYRDGSLMMIEEYEQDKLVRGEYFSNVEKYPASTVEEGKGIATIFDSDGNFVRKIEYLHGKPVMND